MPGNQHTSSPSFQEIRLWRRNAVLDPCQPEGAKEESRLQLAGFHSRFHVFASMFTVRVSLWLVYDFRRTHREVIQEIMEEELKEPSGSHVSGKVRKIDEDFCMMDPEDGHLVSDAFCGGLCVCVFFLCRCQMV